MTRISLDDIEDLACVDDCVFYSPRQEDSKIVTLHAPARYGVEKPACSETLPSGADWQKISVADARLWQREKRETESLGKINLCAKCRDKIAEWVKEQERAQDRKQEYERAQQLKKRVRMADLSCQPPDRRDSSSD